MARSRIPRVALVASLALAGCSGKRGLYIWDGYERSVYRMTAEVGGADVDAEIARMIDLVERSNAGGVAVAPGVHAHLGYLYSLRGELDSALAAFESEKEMYPESAGFIDGLIARMRRMQDGGGETDESVDEQ